MSEKNIRDVVAFLRSEEYPNTAQGLEESLDALLAEHRAALAASESRGYERAREQAAALAHDEAVTCDRLKRNAEENNATSARQCWQAAQVAAEAVEGHIRAMTDERAQGETEPKL